MKALLDITLRDGTMQRIEADHGLTLMEAIRDAGIDELAAMCGGCCSCATCHVHLDAQSFGAFPEMGGDEDDLLDGSSVRSATSRLACQVPLDARLNGASIAIAQED